MSEGFGEVLRNMIEEAEEAEEAGEVVMGAVEEECLLDQYRKAEGHR